MTTTGLGIGYNVRRLAECGENTGLIVTAIAAMILSAINMGTYITLGFYSRVSAVFPDEGPEGQLSPNVCFGSDMNIVSMFVFCALTITMFMGTRVRLWGTVVLATAACCCWTFYEIYLMESTPISKDTDTKWLIINEHYPTCWNYYRTSLSTHELNVFYMTFTMHIAVWIGTVALILIASLTSQRKCIKYFCPVEEEEETHTRRASQVEAGRLQRVPTLPPARFTRAELERAERRGMEYARAEYARRQRERRNQRDQVYRH